MSVTTHLDHCNGFGMEQRLGFMLCVLPPDSDQIFVFSRLHRGSEPATAALEGFGFCVTMSQSAAVRFAATGEVMACCCGNGRCERWRDP